MIGFDPGALGLFGVTTDEPSQTRGEYKATEPITSALLKVNLTVEEIEEMLVVSSSQYFVSALLKYGILGCRVGTALTIIEPVPVTEHESALIWNGV